MDMQSILQLPEKQLQRMTFKLGASAWSAPASTATGLSTEC